MFQDINQGQKFNDHFLLLNSSKEKLRSNWNKCMPLIKQWLLAARSINVMVEKHIATAANYSDE